MNKLIKVGKLFECSKVNSKFLIRNYSNELAFVDFIENGVKQFKPYKNLDLEAAKLDWNFLLNEKNRELIRDNIQKRKGVGDIYSLQTEYKKLVKIFNEVENKSKNEADCKNEINDLLKKLYNLGLELPNITHPDVPEGEESKAKCVKKVGDFVERDRDSCLSIDQISEKFDWLGEQQIGLYSTQKAYILRGDLAHLENALVKYTINYLQSKGFILVSVPDVLHRGIIESCGFSTAGQRTQVYKLDYLNDYGRYCLSGTSEMALAGLLINRVIEEKDLPLKLCAVSRCYRAEVSGSEKEGKLYRLHEFTKVEMFFVTQNDFKISDNMLNEINSHQINLFSNLGLHFQVLDMPTQELGSPAYRKYDIEAWMPYTQRYGEISSASNCTDYQSRRLNLKIKKAGNNETKFAHTLNGTACAVPRLLTCIIENNWDHANQLVRLPNVLQPYMDNREVLQEPKIKRKIERFRKAVNEENDE